MKRIVGIVILLLGLLVNAHAVPPVLNYAGQVTVNGEAFDGNGLFKFALVNSDENATYWSNDGTSVNGYEPQASVSVPVNGGLYAVLLGNTAQQGMGPIDPAVFAQHSDAKLRVWFSDGVNGFQQLIPDRPFASVPYAFSAGTAQTAGSATIAPGSIDRSMLSGDIRSDLNRTISHNDLSPQIKADINATIGLDRLSSAVISKLEQNATITYGSVTASKMADGAVTASKIASNTITTNELSEQILKYLKPEITSQLQASTIYAGGDGSVSFSAEGKYLTYQWKKDGVDLTGETNATLNITDANATLHDGNYSVVVGNDFGSVESNKVEVQISDALLNGLVGWWKFDEGSGTVAYDSSGNDLNGITGGTPPWVTGKIGGALSFNGSNQYVALPAIPQIAGSVAKSLCFFHKPNSNINKSIISLGSANTNKRFCVFQDSSNKYRFVGHYNDLQFNSAVNFLWQHVSAVYENNLLKLYIDGSSAEEESIIGLDTSAEDHGRIAKNSFPKGNEHYHGIIDDVRIYDRALSAEEVQALYNLGQ
ncbi:hypothetical protein N9H45_03295 [Opitutales bacterium]|nr:hypothetical protein [Opitutales bacterium]